MARRKPPLVHGVAVVDKPAGMTSHDVVGQLRRRLGERRIGHAGTLDPDATGMLVVGVGMATRLLQFLQGADKTYSAEVVLGTATSTLDASGEVTGQWDMSAVTADDVRRAAGTLTGDILQVPPMVSALKVDGRRLHELAREGIEVERAARPVRVDRFDVEPSSDPLVYRVQVACSSGTYIRSLAADLGTALGGGAHLRRLRRHTVGLFEEHEAQPIDTCDLLPLSEALRGRPLVAVDDVDLAAVRVGKPLPLDRFAGAPPWGVTSSDGVLVAVYEPFTAGLAKPTVVLVGGEQG